MTGGSGHADGGDRSDRTAFPKVLGRCRKERARNSGLAFRPVEGSRVDRGSGATPGSGSVTESAPEADRSPRRLKTWPFPGALSGFRLQNEPLSTRIRDEKAVLHLKGSKPGLTQARFEVCERGTRVFGT